MNDLIPFTVAIPLVAAAVLAALSTLVPRRALEYMAVAASGSVLTICVVLFIEVTHSPSVYWFGGWRPREGVSLGISFAVEPLGAAMAGFAALLMTCAFLYSWRYFDAVGGLYHVLMLVFLAGMVGLCLTADLFNMFVFFELMSVPAFALTGYKIDETGPLQGALNFAVTNSVAAFLILWGIGLLYARTGALNLAQVGNGLIGSEVDGVVVGAFVCIFVGFLTKAAVVPLHFWLADAHAVAPTPVCILFSGVMVHLGLFGAARVYWSVFGDALGGSAAGVRGVLLAIGVVTALVGGLMCWLQRHLKRLLALSTVSHSGLILIGFALLSPAGLSGSGIYLLAHGLVKAILFMAAGMLLDHRGSVDELELEGRGRGMPITAALCVLGGLGLAGLPPIGTFLGKSLIEDEATALGFPWLTAVFLISSVLTGGAVLRVAGRVFGRSKERDRSQEKETRPAPIVYAPAFALVALLVLGPFLPGLSGGAEAAAENFVDGRAYRSLVLSGEPVTVPAPPPDTGPKSSGIIFGILSALGAAALAAAALRFERLRLGSLAARLRNPLETIRRLHSGHVADYVAWLTFGFALFSAAFVVVLT